MKTSFKRAAAWLLTVLMILSCVPALATGDVTEYSAEEGINLLSDVSTYATNVQVKFNKNGGSGTAPSTITCAKGDTITLPSGETLTKNGYTFMGWGTTANSGGAGNNMKLPIYPAGDSYDVTESITLYAIWGKNSQPAWFYVRLDGQIPNEPNTDTATKAAKYTGTGDDPGDGMKVNNALKYAAFYFNSSGVDSHLKNYPAIENIYAAVEAKSSSIYFGDGSKYQHCTLEEFEQNYYVLWYVIKHPGDNNNVYHVDGVLMKSSLYTVTYDINAPIGSYVGTVPNGTQYREGATVNITSESFTRTGYTFGGWATTEVNGEYKVYNGGDTFQMPANNVKLTAIWIPNSATPYKVEYYYSTGEDESGNPIYADPCYSSVSRAGTTGAHVEVTEADKVPEKNGYVLDDGAEGRLYEGQIAADGSLVLKVYFKYTGGAKKTYTVAKLWVGPEGNSATVNLLADGTTVETLTLNAVNSWSGTFQEVVTYARDGHEIVYTLSEYDVSGYNKKIVGPDSFNNFIVTNTYIPQDVTITVQKVWENDFSNAMNTRPDSLTLTLTGTVTVSEGDEGDVDIDVDGAGASAPDDPELQNVVNQSITLTSENALAENPDIWSTTVKVKDYDSSGRIISYSVDEGTVPTGYSYMGTTQVGKTFTATNRLSSNTLMVKKIIAGNMGDQSKSFNFTIKATGADGTTPVTITVGEASFENGEYTTSLSHNVQTGQIGIPYGAKVTITETNNDANYKQQWSETGAFIGSPAPQTIYTIDSMTESVDVTCKNVKDVVPDTGVVLDSLPYIVILVIVLVGVMLMVRRRRREDD